MSWWIWVVLGAILLGAEVVVTTDFWLVFFGASALVVGLLGAFGVVLTPPLQWGLFALVAVAGLVAYRGPLKRRLARVDREMGPELVGESAVAQGELAEGQRGKVELRGTLWDARNEGPEPIAEGGRCEVVRVDGLTLTVRSE
ncbi:MAG: NfeD family protein [Gemmatimonadetes bacterium]|nr:NfeD family protein [Gemmatimonadota bacterium]